MMTLKFERYAALFVRSIQVLKKRKELANASSFRFLSLLESCLHTGKKIVHMISATKWDFTMVRFIFYGPLTGRCTRRDAVWKLA